MDALGSTCFGFLKNISFFLDNAVYDLIAWFYKILIYLANINILSGDSNNYISNLISRIYVLLGIFMLFKISFSIIQYIADPNAFSDTSKGFGKLVKNVIVSLVLLVSVPWLFDEAAYLQSIILENNVIGQLVMGTTMKTTTVSGKSKKDKKKYKIENAQKLSDNAEENAMDVEFLMYSAFVELNSNADYYSTTKCKSPVIGSQKLAQDTGCLKELENILEKDADASSKNITLYKFFKYCDDNECHFKQRDFSAFSSLINIQVDGTGEEGKVDLVNYRPLISTLAGAYVVFILMMYCLDVAVRVLKLAFLEMIAPIAIVSYVDPKESMSNSKLKNWAKECGSTYASLFIRLATIFLAMMLVSTIANTVLGGLNYEQTGGYEITGIDLSAVYVFLTIGVFMFAKKVPEMIENIFGIKSSGELHLGSVAKGLGMATAGGVIGGGIGGLTSGVASFASARDQGFGLGKSLSNAGKGFITGGGRGALSSARAKDIRGFAKGTFSGVGSASRAVALRDSTKFKDRAGAEVRNAFGMQSKFEALEGRRKMYEGIANKADDMKKRAKDQMSAKDQNYTALQLDKQRIEQMYRNGRMNRDNYREQMKVANEKEDRMIANYINQNGAYLNGGSADIEITSAKEAIRTTVDENGLVKENSAYANVSDWDGIKAAKTAASNKETEIKNSDAYSDAKALKEAKDSGLWQAHINDR